MVKNGRDFMKGSKFSSKNGDSLKDLRFRIQLFAEGGEEGGEGGEGGSGGEGGAKTFTQEEVNKIVLNATKSELGKLLKDLGYDDIKTAKDGVAKFNEWKTSQMSELELAKKEKDDLNTKLAELEGKLTQSSLRGKIVESGIKPEFIDRTIKLLHGEEDVDKALEGILKDFPSFKGSVKSDKGGNMSGKSGGEGADDIEEALKKAMKL